MAWEAAFALMDGNAVSALAPAAAASIYASVRAPSLDLYEGTSAFATEYLTRQLESAQALGQEDDWDGEGAIRITDAVISNTTVIGRHLVALGIGTPEVLPNSNGTVSLEWERRDGKAYLEIGNTQFSFFFRSRDSGAAYAFGPAAEFGAKALFVRSFLVSTPFVKNSASSPFVIAL